MTEQLPTEDNTEVCQAIDNLWEDYSVTQKDLADWIKKEKNIIGFSQSTITNLRTKAEGQGLKIKQLLGYIGECRATLSIKKPDKMPLEINKKLKIYLNQTFYLYFFAIIAKNGDACIARAIVRIGATPDDITIDNAGEDYSTNYKGSVSILKSEHYLVFKMHTPTTGEKNLNAIFRVGADRIFPYAIGCYSNIGTDGAIVAGTLVLEHYTGENSELLKGEILYPCTDSYKNVSDNVKKFFRYRTNNFIKLRTKGIFTEEGFDEFFREQQAKKSTNYRLHHTAANDIFIAFPMTNFEGFESLNQTLKRVAALLRDIYNCNVFFAGEKYQTKSDIMPSSVTVQDNLQELRNASRFILVYPESTLSSALFEAGWALAENKPSVFLYRDINHLPSVLQHLPNQNVRLLKYDSDEDMYAIIKKVGTKLFPE